MSSLGSKIGLVVGGIAVTGVTFFTVAAAKGVALREVPPLAWFVKPVPADEHGAKNDAPPPPLEAPSAHATPIVPPMTAGVLGAFVLPTPFDSRELTDMQKSLEEGLARVAAEDERLKKRERELDDWQHVLQQRADEIAAARQALAHAPTTAPKDKDDAAKSAASWSKLAPLFEDGDPSDVAERLAQLEPDQAAQVLHGLDPERAAALLNALPKERYKAYLDAWRTTGN